MYKHLCAATRVGDIDQISQTDEENIVLSRPYVEQAHKYGIAVEVELGRMEGGEAGLRTISDAKLTDPTKASIYMNE